MKSAEQSPHMEIFLLDDDPGVRGTLRITLGNVGYKVVCFANDRALFKAIRQRTPACIILDAGLRGRSGIETLKYLTGYPAPVIMVSWHEDIPISHRTIEVHRTKLLRKLGVRNSTELLVSALKRNRQLTKG